MLSDDQIGPTIISTFLLLFLNDASQLLMLPLDTTAASDLGSIFFVSVPMVTFQCKLVIFQTGMILLMIVAVFRDFQMPYTLPVSTRKKKVMNL